ncbi:LysM-like peptidoglycan-binding domain-containing protein [Providencia sp. wls1914]|uniref:LysM-like peptidoglycan-binding domain-containing protein n=1 Tax=Providencia sp. wls1914 TaxID=2675156 RepID=UPI0012B56E40|nr:LysM-like peptidoglycan-binding domain-containing protein [Providencia sp. wls1914]MTC70597.1 cell envelope opacity-associated protein A [Providencia sp. wls1914]
MLRLSTFHRYGIAILALIVIAALFWPSSDKPNTVQNNTGNIPNQPIVIPPTAQPNPIPDTVLSQPEQPTTNIPDTSTSLPSEPEVIQEPQTSQPTQQPSTSAPSQPSTTPPSANEWQNYRVQKGKTLAQLFRDNNLQANDAFIMAKVEGSEKPLSNLQQGQKIRLKANGKGEVQQLEITATNGQTYGFTRLSDGSYYRTP